MVISLVGAVVLFFAAFGITFYRPLFAVTLGASAAFPTTAAVTIGTVSIAPFYLLGIVALLAVLASGQRVAIEGRRPVVRLATIFAFAATIITLIAPTIFAGMSILLPRGGIDVEVVDPTPLAYTTSIFAQLAYLVIAVGVVAYFARGRYTTLPLQAAFVTGLTLDSLRFFIEHLGMTWPDGMFRNFAGAGYNPYEQRFFGIFAEPSYLAEFAVAAVAFYGLKMIAGKGSRAVNALFLGAALWQLVMASSGTGALTVVLLCVFIMGVFGVRFFSGEVKAAPAAVIAVTLAFSFVIVWSPITTRLLSVISGKAGSISASHRLAADRFSLDLLLQTHLIGVGLGANRPSSFLTMLLSCVGVIGTFCFIALLLAALKGRLVSHPALAVAWSLVALVTAKVVAEPALSTPLMWLLLGLLGAARSAVGRGGGERSDSAASHSADLSVHRSSHGPSEILFAGKRPRLVPRIRLPGGICGGRQPGPMLGDFSTTTWMGTECDC
jgi:hypothetical protein